MATKTRPKSVGCRVSKARNSTLAAFAVASVSESTNWVDAFPGFNRIATLVTDGTASLINSSRFAVSSAAKSQPRDIASGPRQARDQTEGQHVADRRNDDRDRRCGLLSSQGARGPMGDEHVDVEPKELVGQYRQPVVIALRPTGLDDEIATFDPAEIAKSGAKRRNATCVTGRGHQTEEADTSNLRRLRPRPERPRSSAAEQRDELAPFHRQFLPCFEAEDSTAGDLLHCGNSKELLSAVGCQLRPSLPKPHVPLRPESDLHKSRCDPPLRAIRVLTHPRIRALPRHSSSRYWGGATDVEDEILLPRSRVGECP